MRGLWSERIDTHGLLIDQAVRLDEPVSSGRSSGMHDGKLNLLPHETEDSRITGGTRSLRRRLMGLNVSYEEVSVSAPIEDAKVTD